MTTIRDIKLIRRSSQGRIRDLSEGVLDIYFRTKNPDLETKRRAAGEHAF